MRAPALAALLVVAGLSGCAGWLGRDAPLTVGSTTSTQDAGILDVLLDAFTQDTGIKARAVVAGTGDVIERARRGDVDVLLTHSPTREAALVAEGIAVERRVVMHNRFLLVGPASDPARVIDEGTVASQLAVIAQGRATFVSRGDDSGTHDKERALWHAAGLSPQAEPDGWYRETGSGQAATLSYANEVDAYALTDEATFAQLKANGRIDRLRAFSDDEPALRNEYAVTLLDPARQTTQVAREARAFVDWLAGPDGAAAIAAYRVGGTQVFHPTSEVAA